MGIKVSLHLPGAKALLKALGFWEGVNSPIWVDRSEDSIQSNGPCETMTLLIEILIAALGSYNTIQTKPNAGTL